MAIRREDKVGDEMKRILGRVIQLEVKDPRIPPFTSVTSVTVTRDFSFATAFISVLGTAEEKKDAIRALQKAQGFFRSAVAKQLKLRKTPEITFKLDDTYDTGNRIDQLINEVMGQPAGTTSRAGVSGSTDPADPTETGPADLTETDPAGPTEKETAEES